MRKGIHLTIGILSGILFTQNIWAQTLKEPVIESQAVVVMDMDSGDILYEKNGKEKLYPASIVKLLTALVTAEEGKLDDIVDQGQKSRRIFMDLRRKPFRILPGHSVFDQLRIAGDRRERGLKFMGHVRRKFLPDLGAL